MNRCPASLKIPSLLLSAMLAGLGCLAASEAPAQDLVRQFPAAARRGTLEVTAPPQILMNGEPARLSPGARIKGTSNLLVMSASLVGQALLVNYLRDRQGLVHEVWILNPSEAADTRPGTETRTNIVFESDADRAKTDNGQTPFNQLPSYPRQ